ncbi:MAG: hypothetical protein BYD32DRAFT_408280 [Podila humilis]|nr:MAG: hypothetical protein BYD32DRAFT_408280 [Podila humilis]
MVRFRNRLTLALSLSLSLSQSRKLTVLCRNAERPIKGISSSVENNTNKNEDYDPIADHRGCTIAVVLSNKRNKKEHKHWATEQQQAHGGACFHINQTHFHPCVCVCQHSSGPLFVLTQPILIKQTCGPNLFTIYFSPNLTSLWN